MATTVSEPQTSESTEGEAAPKTPAERKEALGRAMQRQVSLGARVESEADYQAVLSTTRRFNRLLRLVTLGHADAEHRISVSVDESGNTTLHELSR
jgi:hypothetical protein